MTHLRLNSGLSLRRGASRNMIVAAICSAGLSGMWRQGTRIRLMPAGDQPPTQPPPEPTLLKLARKKFATLSPAEEELFRAAQEGTGASRLTGDEKEDNPANAANWNADRVVRGECIAWLCTDAEASALVTYRGLQLYGMRIDSDLDFSNAEIKFPLKAWKCAFSENVSLQDAQLCGLYLVGCLIKSLNADRAKIRGAVLLRNEFKAEGEVRLAGATIDGDLDCSGAQLSNAHGRALRADGAKIGGSVLLMDGFTAEGEVRLVSTTIDGDLDCSGAQLSNAKGWALVANRAKIGGSVFLRNGFKAEGEVGLTGAAIGGDLDCSGAQLSNAKGWALSAGRMKVGSVFLRNGFRAEGEVRLAGATIGGNLDCAKAQFSNSSGRALAVEASKALTVEASKIGGDVLFRDGFQAQGEVNLFGATIRGLQIVKVLEAEQTILDLRLTEVGTFWDDEKSWPNAGNLFLDGFRYERLYEKSPLQADSRKKWLHRQP